MKLNWGFGILITIIVFVSGILTMVYLSFQEKINLVTKDYYPKEIAYEDHIQRIKNTNKLTEKPAIVLNTNNLEIKFPSNLQKENIQGTILIYRPSDYELDKNFVLKLDDSLTQKLPLKDLQRGKYFVQIEWEISEKKYFSEKEIFIE